MQLLNDADLAAQHGEQNSKLTLLRAQQATLAEQIAAEAAALEATERELRRRALTATQAAAGSLDWPDLLREGKGMLHHKDRERVLAALGLASAGFFPDTMQRCIAIMMHQGCAEEVDALAGSLDVVMPYVAPVDGWCSIKVLEHSQAGVYHLRFLPDRSKYQLTDASTRAPEVVFATADLREALAYIQRHHFFDAAPRWC